MIAVVSNALSNDRAVKRNTGCNFMFHLSAEEVRSLKCQIGISKRGRGGRRALTFAFTEDYLAEPSR